MSLVLLLTRHYPHPPPHPPPSPPWLNVALAKCRPGKMSPWQKVVTGYRSSHPTHLSLACHLPHSLPHQPPLSPPSSPPLIVVLTKSRPGKKSSWQKVALADCRPGLKSSHPAYLPLAHLIPHFHPHRPTLSPPSPPPLNVVLAKCRPGKKSSWQKVVLAESRTSFKSSHPTHLSLAHHLPHFHPHQPPPSPPSPPPLNVIVTKCRPGKRPSWQHVVTLTEQVRWGYQPNLDQLSQPESTQDNQVNSRQLKPNQAAN